MIFHCARPTRAFGGRALREHWESLGPHSSACTLPQYLEGVAKVAL